MSLQDWHPHFQDSRQRLLDSQWTRVEMLRPTFTFEKNVGVPYGSRTRVAAVKEKRPVVIQRNLAAWIALMALQGLTGTVVGPLMDAPFISFQRH